DKASQANADSAQIASGDDAKTDGLANADAEAALQPQQEVEEMSFSTKAYQLLYKIVTLLGKCFGALRGILTKVFSKLTDLLKNIKGKLKAIYDKVDYWITFLKMPSTPKALGLILLKSKKLIKHILPRKMEGYLKFGTEDPYTTGSILAGIEMFYPLWGSSFIVDPDFENKVMEGNVRLKGRIYLFYLAFLGLTTYFNKNVKTSIAYLKADD
ncbi:MAG: DUF2953 domain-containing protein, partial [Lachnospiraceae bacterium]|nr:DUF2953 domain-containing protein [Candidatus Equihabitans merdae]